MTTISMTPVRDFPGYYITKCGEVFSDRNFSRGGTGKAKLRQLKTHPNTHGYLDIVLSISGRRTHKAVHRLVAETFLDKTNNCVNHIDGNPLNNCVGNLEWCSHAENLRHAGDTGLTARGDAHWKVKLTSDKLKLARELRAQGLSGRKIAKLFGLSQWAVNKRLAGG